MSYSFIVEASGASQILLNYLMYRQKDLFVLHEYFKELKGVVNTALVPGRVSLMVPFWGHI